MLENGNGSANDDRSSLVPAGADDPKLVRFIEAAIGAASAPRVTRPQRPAASVVPQIMQRAWKKLRGRVRRWERRPTTRDLHRIRIQAKHARYAAEALIPISRGGARRFGRRAEALQVLLGEQHDAVTAGIAVRENLADGVQAFIGGEFVAIERAAARHLRNRFPRCWKRLARPKRRRFWV